METTLPKALITVLILGVIIAYFWIFIWFKGREVKIQGFNRKIHLLLQSNIADTLIMLKNNFEAIEAAAEETGHSARVMQLPSRYLERIFFSQENGVLFIFLPRVDRRGKLKAVPVFLVKGIMSRRERMEIIKEFSSNLREKAPYEFR